MTRLLLLTFLLQGGTDLKRTEVRFTVSPRVRQAVQERLKGMRPPVPIVLVLEGVARSTLGGMVAVFVGPVRRDALLTDASPNYVGTAGVVGVPGSLSSGEVTLRIPLLANAAELLANKRGALLVLQSPQVLKFKRAYLSLSD